jgi:hypothetical protein
VLREESTLAGLALIGALVYGSVVMTLFRRRWFAACGRLGKSAGTQSG